MSDRRLNRARCSQNERVRVGHIEIDQRAVSRLCYAGAWALGAPMLALDGENVRFANRALCGILGYADPRELLGRDVGSVVRGLMGAVSSLNVGGGSEVQPAHRVSAKLLRKQGGSRQESAYVASIEADGTWLTLLVFYAAQTSEPKHSLTAEREIGPKDPELGRAILEALPSPVLIQDVDTILFANAAARSYVGASKGTKLEGAPIASIVHPDGLDAMFERVRFVFEAQHRLQGVPVKLRTPDGRSLHVVADAYPVESDGLRAALIVATSVSEGKSD